ncbi:hypothetical protein HGRIS_008113 [Hohenbuehelia grisea]|uniref:RNase III domain-containing protein n=1 Tax=Hohenbuehelia grisea TaxID=104357 RepID=A0ABR3J6Z4_9AGAR
MLSKSYEDPPFIHPSPVSPSSIFKRTRSPEGSPVPEVFLGSEPPKLPLPEISCDLILEVFTHASLRGVSGSNEERGDNERLATLGASILDFVTTFEVFRRKPFCKAEEITPNRLSRGINYSHWVQAYGLKYKLLMDPSAFHEIDSPEVARTLFRAYVGAAYIEHGMDKIQPWICELFAYKPPEATISKLQAANPNSEALDLPPAKRIKSEPQESVFPSVSHVPRIPKLSETRLPLPSSLAPIPNPMTPAQPDFPFISSFMQACRQRGVTADFHEDFSGAAHAGLWTVECIVNGIKKGIGSGENKQVAKEASARNAYYAMGWA